jgi:hypothetical protein
MESGSMKAAMPVPLLEFILINEGIPFSGHLERFLLAGLVLRHPVQAVDVPEKEREKQDDGGKYEDHSVFF